MKQKISYLFFSLVLMLLTVTTIFGETQAEATQGAASWSTSLEVHNSKIGRLTLNESRSNTPSRFFTPVKNGGIQVIKYDKYTKARLSGAQFTIYDSRNQAVEVIQSNYNGVAETRSLSIGRYSIRETKAPAGYQLESTAKYVSLFRSGQRVCLMKCNTPLPSQKGTLQIIKTDGNNQFLAGAVFDVYNSNNQFVGRITTDTNGVASLGNLPYDTYKLIEIKAPAGYELDAVPRYVTLSALSPNKTVSITISNKKVVTTGALEVIKKDETGQLSLAGAKFEVRDSQGKVVGNITTDAKGIATLKELPFGTYTLIETRAPIGYELDSTPKYVTLSKNDPNGKISIEVVNKKEAPPVLGSIKIIKYVKDSVPIVYLSGAIFEVYNNENTKIGEYTTDNNGEIVLNNLEPGKYYVVEIEAPPGYEEDLAWYEVTVQSGKVAEVKHANIKKENVGSLKITKFAKDSDGYETDTVLPNAEFEVTDSVGKVHIGTTDTQGELFFHDLPIGEVTITETRAPEGYEIDPVEQTKTIRVEKMAEAVFYNKPKVISGRAIVYLSSSNTNQTLQGLAFRITCKGTGVEKTVVSNRFGQMSIYLSPGEYSIKPAVKDHLGIIKSTSFKIEANRFTIIRLEI